MADASKGEEELNFEPIICRKCGEPVAFEALSNSQQKRHGKGKDVACPECTPTMNQPHDAQLGKGPTLMPNNAGNNGKNQDKHGKDKKGAKGQQYGKHGKKGQDHYGPQYYVHNNYGKGPYDHHVAAPHNEADVFAAGLATLHTIGAAALNLQHNGK